MNGVDGARIVAVVTWDIGSQSFGRHARGARVRELQHLHVGSSLAEQFADDLKANVGAVRETQVEQRRLWADETEQLIGKRAAAEIEVSKLAGAEARCLCEDGFKIFASMGVGKMSVPASDSSTSPCVHGASTRSSVTDSEVIRLQNARDKLSS